MIRKHRQGLWVLAAAVCLMQLMPLHLHLHHDENSGTAGISHALDIHAADTAADQLHHDDAHVIDLSVEILLKSLDGDSQIPFLFLCLLTVLLYPAAQRGSWRAGSTAIPPQQLFLIFSPLRAPPRA